MSATAVSLERRMTAELVGTAFLLAAVVGSGIMAERISGGNAGLALLANTLATALMLVVLILALGAVSGAHFNPVVTLGAAWERSLRWREVPGYLAAQVGGAFLGVVAAHLMFGEPVLAPSTQARSGAALAFSELVATFGLVLVLRCVARARPGAVAASVAAYIASAYWFTASTSFANPAVTLARAYTDTFAGIRPGDAPLFLAAQLAGAAAATGLFAWLVPEREDAADRRQRASRASARDETPLQTVLFACVHNAGRSQIAAAFFAELADPERARALSAGTRPSERVHPGVVSAMAEVGIDLAGVKPQRLTPELAAGADLLVTLGCGEECPVIPGLRVVDWPLGDPKDQPSETVRAIRAEIRARVQALVDELGVGPRPR